MEISFGLHFGSISIRNELVFLTGGKKIIRNKVTGKDTTILLRELTVVSPKESLGLTDMPWQETRVETSSYRYW